MSAVSLDRWPGGLVELFQLSVLHSSSTRQSPLWRDKRVGSCGVNGSCASSTGQLLTEIESSTSELRFCVPRDAKRVISETLFQANLLAGLVLKLLTETTSASDVVSRLTYASPAWRGFITATDRQRVDAFLSRFCPPDVPDFNQLLEDADDQLFERILNNPHHTLYQLLPPQSAASQNYNLRRRTRGRQLHEH